MINLSAQDIQTRQHEIEIAESANRQIYQTALNDRDQQRAQFRYNFPRKNFPNSLKEGVQPPPALNEKWRKLLRQREKHFYDLELKREEKKWTFLDRMENGRVNALQRRERAMRQLINQTAAEHGIELYERALDVRLAELLNRLTKTKSTVAEVEIDDEPLVVC